MSFSTVGVRQNGQNVLANWWNDLRTAGVALEGGGFVAETKFTLTNGQASAASVTGASFDSTVYTAAYLPAEIRQKTSTDELIWVGTIRMFWRALTSTWDVEWAGDGDEPGITFTVLTTSTTGQLQYTLGTLSGSSYVGTLKYRAQTFGV